jgi:hypothetical protein
MDQPTEASGQLFVIVIDETYDGDEQSWEADSEQYRRQLEQEFEAVFQKVNVGPGADIPAFLTELINARMPLWSATLVAFFAGKGIKENLEAWTEMAHALRRFFARPIILARHGAAVLALEAVFDEMGGMPRVIRLVRYRPGHLAEHGSPSQANLGDGIEESPLTLKLGYVVHLFEIEADGVLFRVSVDGKRTEVSRIG